MKATTRPVPGRMVRYQTDGRGGLNYFLPAIVTVTRRENLQREGVDRGDIEDLDSDLHVHLTVFTPGAQGVYTEQNVPHDRDGSPRSWRWHWEGPGGTYADEEIEIQ